MRKLYFGIIAAILAAILLAGCAPAKESTGRAEKILLSASELTLEVGETSPLTAEILPDGTDLPLSWTTDDSAVATVSAGTVSAVSDGTAKITAEAGGKSAVCTVTVRKKDDEIKRDGYLLYENFQDRAEVPQYLNVQTDGEGEANMSDGALTLRANSGGASASYAFQDAMNGTFVAEALVRADSNDFVNVLCFQTGSGKAVVCLGMDAGGFRYYDGSDWSASVARYEVGEWYDVRMLIDTDNAAFDLYVGNDRYEDLPFAAADSADSIGRLIFGSVAQNSAISYRSIKVYREEVKLFPVIDAEKSAYTAALDAKRDIVLEYTVSGNPEPSLSLTCDRPDEAEISADNRTVTLKEDAGTGAYTFTLYAENDVSVTVKTFTLTVREREETLLDADFSDGGLPFGMQLRAQGGTAGTKDGALCLRTNEAASSASVTAVYDFIDPLVGEVRFDTRVMNRSVASDHFLNVLFLYKSEAESGDPNLCTIAVAIEKNVLKYHNGSGWQSITAVENGAWIDIVVTVNFDTRRMKVELDGNEVLSNAVFRNPSFSDDTAKLIIGSTKLGCELVYDSLRVNILA